MSDEQHVIETPERTGTCKVRLTVAHICLTFHFSRVGDLEDGEEIIQWIDDVFTRYEKDDARRLITLGNYLTGDAGFMASLRKFRAAVMMLAFDQGNKA